MIRLTFINPNATQAMTDNIGAAARAALPEARVTAIPNTKGPLSIQGPEDGDAAVPGMLGLIPPAIEAGAQAIVISCFDDTGLKQAQAISAVPVLGIGQASYLMAAALGRRFSVVTSLPVSTPVIEGNIREQGFSWNCASIRPCGIPVLEIDEGSEATRARLADEIALARDEDGAQAVVLGCAGMAVLEPDLAARTGMVLIDGVAAAAHLARAALGFSGQLR